MHIGTYLRISEQMLKRAKIATARLDSLVMLEDITTKDRSWIIAHPEFELTSAQLNILDKFIKRRAKHEPLAYIRGKSEFYGREFIVNRNTLEPRPETEAMVDYVKSIVKSRENITIADIGTGTGCIAVSVKLELPSTHVVGTDSDVKTLKTARENSQKHSTNIEFYHGDLVKPLVELPNILLCNLPYVPDEYEINKPAVFEPPHAIFGGPDGLNLYRRLFQQIIEAQDLQRKNKANLTPLYVLTESLPFQHEDLSSIASAAGYKLVESDNFIQVFKFAAQPQE